MSLSLVTVAERPELEGEMLRLGASPWPVFLNHGAVVMALWRFLYQLAPDYQFALLDEQLARSRLWATAFRSAGIGTRKPSRTAESMRFSKTGWLVCVIHDTQGNIRGVVAASPGAPPDAGPGEPGELLSEVELDGYSSEASDDERLESLMRVAQDFRVEFERTARLVPKPQSSAGASG